MADANQPIDGEASLRDREARLRESRALFEPLHSILDLSDTKIRNTLDALLAHNNEIRSEINRRMYAMAESSIVDPSNSGVQFTLLEGHHFLTAYTDGSCMRHPLTSRNYFGGGVFFGINSPHNTAITMNDSVNNITSAEMGAIMNAFTKAPQIVDGSVTRLLIVADNMAAVRLTRIITSRSYTGSNNLLTATLLSNDPSIRKAIDTIVQCRPRWHTVRVEHVHSHSGRLDIHSRGNQAADALATEACRANWVPDNNLTA